MNNTIIVIGGGLAGVRVSIELLQQRFRVYLLEEGPSVSAKMSITDNLFPPNEDASCAYQPLMLELTSNPNATILTSSKMLSLQGRPGDFRVKVLKKQDDINGSSQSIEFTVGAVIVSERFDIERSDFLDQFGLEINDKGYPRGDSHSDHPYRTIRDGVFMCCSSKEPENIGELIVQACAAAANAAALLASVRGDALITDAERIPPPINTTDEPKIAVVIDQRYASISEVLNLDELCEYTRSLSGVECVELTSCSYDDSKITELLKTGDFNRLVVAGPSPIMHEYLYHRHAESAGLNRYLLEIVNLYSQCAAVHSDDRTVATNKAKTLIKMGVARVSQLEPIEELSVPITQSCLVVGGSVAGLACAVKLAEMNLQVELVEKNPDLAEIPGNDHPFVIPLVDRCLAEDNVNVHANAKTLRIRTLRRDSQRHKAAEPDRSAIERGQVGRPDQWAVVNEQMQRISEAMAELPLEQREVITLRFEGGMGFRQIARLQNASINTVQGRYRYGMEKLRSLLNSEAET